MTAPQAKSGVVSVSVAASVGELWLGMGRATVKLQVEPQAPATPSPLIGRTRQYFVALFANTVVI